ncbi:MULTISPECIES: carboxymuconolactone decarboxylase family protein [unclassified Amycolatopsis]|uniref:carboxymuconolactone decarboxylase family protein n=1 Tax=unclassified Amycolatopsis TaxID=2618356 RepID=UPI002E12B55E|nr:MULTISPECIES: carboxymuconolactone decarboxylase family protein [unclassified Amycolatopsis]WSK76587.1 carboxymuconolactone decarboxylase family protein [Amycolatopsis sp. NBC_01286]
MPHIPLDPELPGIRSLMAYRPETAVPLNLLAQTLLRGPSSLTVGERELIATVVSNGNECRFCTGSHAATAAETIDGGRAVVDAACAGVDDAPVSEKLKALLRIALAVRETGRNVTDELVAAARAQDATDLELHDTVLIAAAFCMYNRYVDGLATIAPDDPAAYEQMGKVLAAEGYGR